MQRLTSAADGIVSTLESQLAALDGTLNTFPSNSDVTSVETIRKLLEQHIRATYELTGKCTMARNQVPVDIDRLEQSLLSKLQEAELKRARVLQKRMVALSCIAHNMFNSSFVL